MSSEKSVAVIGSGPAGLMTAHVLSSVGIKVNIFERRPGAGRKLLIAGSSGLNVSNTGSQDSFLKNYTGPLGLWKSIISEFTPEHWIQFIQSLGLETFSGTSGRYFVSDMKGATLLQAWVDSLKSKGVEFFFNYECSGFNAKTNGVELEFSSGEKKTFLAVCFAVGGGSWEKSPVTWPKLFTSKGIEFRALESSNCGFEVDWPAEFLKEAEGQPLKDISFTSSRGTRVGELMITHYGLEGTPIYALGEVGEVSIDLKPSWRVDKILEALESVKENLLPMRRAKKTLGLSEPALALLFHLSAKEVLADNAKLAEQIKKFTLHLKRKRPLEEAISSRGGISWNEVDNSLMLKKLPRVYVAGEMLDWDAPTGGYLIQGCVSQGYVVGKAIQRNLSMY